MVEIVPAEIVQQIALRVCGSFSDVCVEFLEPAEGNYAEVILRESFEVVVIVSFNTEIQVEVQGRIFCEEGPFRSPSAVVARAVELVTSFATSGIAEQGIFRRIVIDSPRLIGVRRRWARWS